MDFDYKRYKILYVDDEAKSLKYFQKLYCREFAIITAKDAKTAWDLLTEKHGEIGILITDQRMPNESGVELLEKVRQAHPDIIRILATAYSDIDSAVAAVNTGAIYKYVQKPWNPDDLRVTLLRALDFFYIQSERNQLLVEKMSVIQQLIFGSQEKDLALLASGMSPFLRNVLRAAKQFTDVVPQRLLPGGTSAAIRDHLEWWVKSEGDNVLKIIASLRLAHDDRVNFSPVSCTRALIETAVADVKKCDRLQHFEGAVNLPDEIRTISANGRLLQTLFSTLIVNITAVNASVKKITFDVREVRINDQTNGIAISLSDHEAPWTNEQWGRFFSPFASLDYHADNYGIGLFSCYLIVHHHGGSVTVEGDRKSKITVTLPANPDDIDELSLEEQCGLLRTLFGSDKVWEYFANLP